MQAARGFNLSTKNPAFSNSKKVIVEISNTIRGSNVQWRRGRSFAASVPSDSSKSQGGRNLKRVSKDERRAMLESFVDKYRTLNAGKYPTPTAAIRQVGGGYYAVKKILQELEYNSRVAATSMGSGDALVQDVQERESQSLPEVEVAASTEMTFKSSSSSSVKEMDESCKEVINKLNPATKSDYEEKEPEDLIHVEDPLPEAVNDTKPGEESSSIISSVHQIDSDSKEVSHACREDNVKEAAERKGSLDINDPKGKVPDGDDLDSSTSSSHQLELESKVVLHTRREATLETCKEAPDSDKHDRETPSTGSKEDPSSTKSTLWGNLRSFADGIINLWRKM